MNSMVRIKWIGSFILAGILLTLALTGGDWGTSYAAEDGINLVPYIDHISPIGVRVGSSDRVVIISGGNWGNIDNTRVRLTAPGFEVILPEPLYLMSNGISQNFPAYLFTEPKLYMVTVVVSEGDTVPELPLDPDWDVVSNEVPFLVYEPQFMYLPDLYK